jgi:hypothetical protein
MKGTRDKLGEAKYFLACMEKTNRDKNAFRYNLSAFLSASRSVTFFMQKEFKKMSGFESWYLSKQSQMAGDKIFRFFNDQRVKTIHEQPVSARTHQNRINIPEIDIFSTIEFTITTSIDEDGIMDNPQMTRVTEQGVTVEEITADTLWIFDDLPLEDNFGCKDVFTLCKEHVEKLESLVEECEESVKYFV